MKIKLRMAIMSHLSDAQTINSFEGYEKRIAQEIGFAVKALEQNSDLLPAEKQKQILGYLSTALQKLGTRNCWANIDNAKLLIMDCRELDVEKTTEELDAIFYA